MKWINMNTGIGPRQDWIEVELKDGTTFKATMNYYHSDPDFKECRCDCRLNRCKYIVDNRMVRWRTIDNPYPSPFEKDDE